MTTEIDWNNLTFSYSKTDFNVRTHYRNGVWSHPEATTDDTVRLHMASTALHYGQTAFEGLKAFKGKDGKIRIFRMRDNALRMIDSCRGILMAPPSIEVFEATVLKAVKLNQRFIPPYDSGASLYIRPVIFGTSPQVGVKPASEYTLIVFVSPVGPYFPQGFTTSSVAIYREFDRAAPLGTGRFKVGGNYAAGLRAGDKAHEAGYASVLYLDAKEKKYIDECGPANFFAIKNNTYITPKSDSILPSITNKSLMQLARDNGMVVEQRPVAVEELSSFQEAGMCGTAAIISPIDRIDDIEQNHSYIISADKTPGSISTQLYNQLRAIQYGELPDSHGWNTILE